MVFRAFQDAWYAGANHRRQVNAAIFTDLSHFVALRAGLHSGVAGVDPELPFDEPEIIQRLS